MKTSHHKVSIAALSMGLMLVLPSASRADNPIIQTLYTADPAPMVHDGKVYLYTTHDEDVIVNNFFTMNDWRVYSSTDMVNWTDHGSPLHYSAFRWAGGNAWAGQVVYRNGRFYFYVPVTRFNGSQVIGVAVADSPTGPFQDALGRPLITSDCGDIDPSVFIDDDGQAYLYWGNPNLCYVRLNEDMTSYSGGVVHVPLTTQSFGIRSNSDRPTSYEEGPWFYKREGRYYMVFAAGPISEHIGYSTSTGPTGPWTYGGVVMPTQGRSFTNHPGVIDYKGKSFFFYHNGALPGGGGFHRSVCVEEFSYGADGRIPRMNMTTRGAAAVDTLNPFARTEAETIAWESGIETEICSEGGMNVTSIDNGDYIKVKEVDFGSGATAFEARVASAHGGGAIELRLDSEYGTVAGTCAVGSTGGDQAWATLSCPVSGVTGKHDLFLRFTGGGFKLNWWRFSAAVCSDSSTCDNGLFCDGVETCSDEQFCVTGTPPCPGPCDEVNDRCVEDPGATHTIVVRMRGFVGDENVSLQVGGSTVQSWVLSTVMSDYPASTTLGGEIRVAFTNDNGARDVQVDYISINGEIRQAEDQADNTGAWDGECGAGSYTEMLHCNGSIGFGVVAPPG